MNTELERALGWVTGDAKVPDGVALMPEDTIEIPKGTSLTVGNTKISGGAGRIEVNVNVDGTLNLPVNTVVTMKDGTTQTIGEKGGKLSPDGTVENFTEYTVTIVAEGGGTASADPASAKAGTTINLTAVPEQDHQFKRWQVVSGIVTIENNSFTMPASNVEIEAIFEETAKPRPDPVPHSVTVDSSKEDPTQGSTTASPASAVKGTVITLTATAEEGYHFKRWHIIPVDITITGNQFIMPDRDVTVWAEFERDTVPQPTTYPVTVNDSYAMSSGAGSYTAGTTVSIHAGTRDNYRFTGWTSQDGIIFANAGSADTTFTMPEQAVTVTAHWVRTGGDSFDDSSSGGSSSGDTTYHPTVEQSSNGTVTVSSSNPKRGDPVIITPRPDAGYEVDTVTVTDQNGHAVEVRKNADGTYTFIQPGSRVRIEVTYQRSLPAQPVETPWSSPFTDVSQGDWYYEAVRFVQEQGLMNGYGDGRFGPNDTLSRAQLVQILFNREGRPVVHDLPDFSDVADEAWYAGAVRWAAGRGIAGGYGDGRFGPDDPITREQLAVMLWRYAGSPAAGGELPFDDADEVSPFAREAVGWAVESGILHGGGDGRLAPQGLATRAQAAQMLKNFLENR